MTFEEWVRMGYIKGYCSSPICYTHDGIPLSEEEEQEFEESDPCIHIVRLYDTLEHKQEIEENSPIVTWRAKNQGWED